MTEDRVEGRYEQLEELSARIAVIGTELEEIVTRLGASTTELREAWPDHVGTVFTDEIETVKETLEKVAADLEERAAFSKAKSEQLRAVHE